jgi:hypothetical protein
MQPNVDAQESQQVNTHHQTVLQFADMSSGLIDYDSPWA